MICLLDIETARIAQRSVISKSFASAPLKIVDITENKQSADTTVMLMSSSPGILDGDQYDIDISVGHHCSLKLQTQSYQRLYNMKQGATQKMQVQVSENACFSYLPHPLVPHTASNFSSVSTIFLQPSSTLIWGEIVTCGRKQNNEFFSFAKIHLRTKVYVQKKLLISENLYLDPAQTNHTSLGLWEGYTHQASLICISEFEQGEQIVLAMRSFLDLQQNVLAGVSSPMPNTIIVRLMGYKGEQMHQILQHLATIVKPVTKPIVQYAG